MNFRRQPSGSQRAVKRAGRKKLGKIYLSKGSRIGTRSIRGKQQSPIRAQKAFNKVVSTLIALPAVMEKPAFAASWKDKPADQRRFIPHPRPG